MNATVLLEGLVRRFGKTTAVDGIDLELSHGELFGLVGPDGAGKTTTVRMLAGLIAPDGGRVRVLGEDPLTSASVRDVLGLMPQEYSLYLDLSIRENLQFFGRLYGLGRAEWARRVERLMRITRLEPFMDRRAGALSGGMYKKLALSCALLHEPKVLLLDEPTNGVDPVSRRELWDLIHEFVQGGMTVLVCTPYMDEAERCHRVGLLHRGRLIATGEPAALIRDLEHETYTVHAGAGAELFDEVFAFEDVLAASPAGSELRIVVRGGRASEVQRRLDALGGRLEACEPTFEDLFLVRIKDAEGMAA